jgi:hypothetical protein
MIDAGENGWKEMLPEGIPALMEQENLFGCNNEHASKKHAISSIKNSRL